ncbi:MAG TPA: MFS transporter, partial [Catalimonadaceae bacterium]|nr:MFS transporter [Catalimonadaceae bacterium]
MAQALKKNVLNAAVVISAIGYFVDIYDLIIFNVVKKRSLEALGYVGDAFKSQEIYLFNLQMGGMLLGGLLWGILGDRKGRASVLFGSILMYSLANIANAFVPNVEWYGVCRFVAGVGLAGELGAGITLVLESMDKEQRGYGTMIIVTLGALGAVVASLVGKIDWQLAYITGGVMGLLILLLRVTSLESG